MRHITPLSAIRVSSPRTKPWQNLIRHAVVGGLLVAALGVALAGWCFGRIPGEASQAQSPENEALHHGIQQALAYIVPEGGDKGGCGVLIDQQERLVVTVARHMGERTGARISFAGTHGIDSTHSISADAGTVGDVVFRDSTRSLVLLRLQHLPAGAAALPLGDWTPSTTMMLHSVRSSQPGAASARAHAWSYCQGKIERILMRPHY
jgi:hypothetical protein